MSAAVRLTRSGRGWWTHRLSRGGVRPRDMWRCGSSIQARFAIWFTTYRVETNLSMQTMKTLIWVARTWSNGVIKGGGRSDLQNHLCKSCLPPLMNFANHLFHLLLDLNSTQLNSTHLFQSHEFCKSPPTSPWSRFPLDMFPYFMMVKHVTQLDLKTIVGHESYKTSKGKLVQSFRLGKHTTGRC
jgi:hypothetical protein